MTTTHPRAAIRAAIRDRLAEQVDGQHRTPAGDRVWASRTRRIALRDMPVIVVWAREEKVLSVQQLDVGEISERELTLTIGGVLADGQVDDDVVAADSDLDSRLDQMAESIETAFLGWSVPGYEGSPLTLEGTDLHVDVEGAEPTGNVLLTYSIRYFVSRSLDIEEPPVPSQVLASWSPDIGIPHEPDYKPVDGRPEVWE